MYTPNGAKNTYVQRHDRSIIIMIPLILLSLFRMFFGYIAKDLYVGMGTDFINILHPNNVSLIEAEIAIPLLFKLLPLLLTLSGRIFAYYVYNHRPSLFNPMSTLTIYTFFNGKYLIDNVYNHYIIHKGLQLGYDISKILDRGLIEQLGPHGLTITLQTTSLKLTDIDTGRITHYALYLVLGRISILRIQLFSLSFPFIILKNLYYLCLLQLLKVVTLFQ